MTLNNSHIELCPEFVSLVYDERQIYFKLDSGRTVTVPLMSFPKLASATVGQRENYHTNGVHIFWDDIDEIIGVKNILGPGATKY